MLGKYTSHSIEETAEIARKWLKEISVKYADSNTALVVGLSGDLGAGKTAFTKAIAKELGITDEVTSPTFVIMKQYPITQSSTPWKKLIHIDAYRLERAEEVQVLGFGELVADPKNLILIEWPENIGPALSSIQAYNFIQFSVPPDTDTKKREITFQ
ncbi:MAG: tRNA (adenosine(37)-N6)-threonylcarbamoyltransferase complex ATPase subunit type 1 TsaE [Patescibacteria group bacterium]